MPHDVMARLGKNTAPAPRIEKMHERNREFMRGVAASQLNWSEYGLSVSKLLLWNRLT
jgi:hypothetical protein